MKFLKTFFKHPWIIIVISVAITGALGFFLKDLALSNSTREFFPQKDESYVRLNETEDTFGSMLSIGVSLNAKEGTILTPEFIEVVRKISDRVLELADVEDIDSLTDIDFVCDQDGSISATQLIPDTYTGSPEDIQQLKNRLNEWNEMYNRVIINDDMTGTQMQISLRPKSDVKIAYETAKDSYTKAKAKVKELKAAGTAGEELAAAEQELNEIKAEYKVARKAFRLAPPDSDRERLAYYDVRKIVIEECKGHNINYKFYGDPIISDDSKSFMVSDLVRLIPLVVVVVVITLYMSFHTVDGTILPLICVLMATIQACGLMALFHIQFTLVSSVIPVALIAVGSAYGIHVMTHYYVALQDVEGELTKEIHEQAVFKGLKEVWLAVLLAGITTIVGFISLINSPLEPLHSFAIFTAVGVGLSLILAITFIPALILVKDIRKIKSRNRIEKLADKVRERIDRAQQRRGGRSVKEASGDTLYNIYHFFCGSGVRLILTALVIITISAAGIRLLKIDTSFVSYFPKSSRLRKDIDFVNEEFAGTNSVYLIVTGQEKGDITNTDLLNAVDGLENHLAKKYDDIGKIVSLNAFIKRINQVWHTPAMNDTIAADDSFDSFAADEGGALDSWADDFSSSDFSSDNSLAAADDFASDDFSDFSSDDFSDFSSDDGALDSWADEFADSSVESEEVPSDFVDPNIAYKEILSRPASTQEILSMIHESYVEAGGKNATPEDIVEILMKKTNYNGMAYYEIPSDVSKYPVISKEQLKGVVDNYLILLSGSLDRFIDDDLKPKKMRITCQLRNHSTTVAGEIIKDAQQYAAEHFPEGYTIEATGTGEMEYTMTSMIVSSQLSSLLISLLSVFVIIALSFKSAWAGILGAIPLALTIILNYMTMGFAGINLDLITSIIASVAVGVGIDYTIHFLSTYREERSKTRDLEIVTKQTFRKSGHGIVTNALAVAFGFLVLCLSKFVVLRYIGILVAIVMLTSSFLAMTIIPGILNLTDPKFMRPKKEPSVEVVDDDDE